MTENEFVTVNTGLKVKGVALDLRMIVPAKPVKPHRMLPVFQQMANTFTDLGIRAVEAEGKSISCKAGCWACCRQPVPIAEVEVYQIAELVEGMPEPRRSVIRKRFADAVEHFHRNGLIEELRTRCEPSRHETYSDQIKETLDVGMKFFYEGIPCPFLEGESCSIYQDRPIACREYLVTSPAINCEKPTAKDIQMVPLELKPSRTVKQLGRTGRLKDEGLLLLVRALELAERYPEEFREKTGPEWMADFFGKLTGKPVTEGTNLQRSLRRVRKKRKRLV